MFKKLQNLLFEDDDEELEEQEEVAPVREVKSEPVAPQPVVKPVEVKPVVENIETKVPEAPAMPQINTDAEENKKPSVAPEFNSLFEEEKPVEQPKPQKPLGITIDPEQKPRPAEQSKPKKVEKEVKKTELPRKTEKKEVSSISSYQFNPVISPIFGVDEKDLTAVKNTAVKFSASEKSKNDRRSNGIISPMYGSNTTESLLSAEPVVEDETTTIDDLVTPVPNFPNEDDIPEFSLDDILKVRDEEYEDNANVSSQSTAPFVFDFDDEEEPIDETLVMSKEDFTKSTN